MKTRASPKYPVRHSIELARLTGPAQPYMNSPPIPSRSHLGQRKIFHMSTHKWVSAATWNKVFFNQFCFFRCFFNKNIRFAWMNGNVAIICFSRLYVTVYFLKILKNLKPLCLFPAKWQTFWLKWDRRFHMNVG